MTEKELKEYISTRFSKESESCEWKEMKNLGNSFVGNDKKDVVSYVSAISNMEGGHLVIGVKDQTLDIVGTDLSKFLINGIPATTDAAKFKIIENCTNIPTEGLSIEEFVTDDTNKTVWIVNIPKHAPRKMVIAHRKAWQRLGDSIVEIESEREKQILTESIIGEDWSAVIIPEATSEWLDEEAVKMARNGFQERYPAMADISDTWTDEVFLDKAKLTINKRITRTALLLLGKSEYQPYLNHISQIVWRLRTNTESGGDIFGIPFLKSTQKILNNIRNYRFKIYPRNTMIPIEVWKYDTKSILEALHNCIAHQQYEMNARIIVTENEDKLCFENSGSFFLGSYEDYIEGNKTPDKYRNPFLVNAMVNVKMIDTQGYGIHNIFSSQRNRYLPMPDYDLTEPNKVKLSISGNIIDENYSLQLIENVANLTLTDVVLLDKVQKHISIPYEARKMLRSKNLIEGKNSNIYVSRSVASITGTEVEYTLNKGLDDLYYEDYIFNAISEHKKLSRKQIEGMVVPKLPNGLTDSQKKSKVGNILTKLRKLGKIKSEHNKWMVSTPTKTSD